MGGRRLIYLYPWKDYGDEFRRKSPAELRDYVRQRLETINKKERTWIVIVAGVGFLADAYAIFAINFVIPMLEIVYWQGSMPQNIQIGLTTATLGGSMLGQLLFGIAADWLGRRRTYGWELIVTIVATIGVASASSGISGIVPNTGTFQAHGTYPSDGIYNTTGQYFSSETYIANGIDPWNGSLSIIGGLVAWRFVLGLAIGADYPLSAVICSEFAPKKNRAHMLSAVFFFQPLGQLAATLIALIVTVSYGNTLQNYDQAHCYQHPKCLRTVDMMWRIIIGVGALLPVVALGFRLAILESPRYTADVLNKGVKAAAQLKQNSMGVDPSMPDQPTTGVFSIPPSNNGFRMLHPTDEATPNGGGFEGAQTDSSGLGDDKIRQSPMNHVMKSSNGNVTQNVRTSDENKMAKPEVFTLQQEESRQEESRQEESRQEESRQEESRQEESRQEESRQEESRQEESRQEESRQEESRQEESRQEESRQEESKKEESRQEESRQEESRQEESRQEESKKEESRQEESKKEESRQEESRQEESRQEESKKEESRQEESKKEESQRKAKSTSPNGLRADIKRYFGHQGHYRTLIATSLCWFCLDLPFYGLGMNSTSIISQIWADRIDNTPNETDLYTMLLSNTWQSLIFVSIGALTGGLITLFSINTLGERNIQMIGFLALFVLFNLAGGLLRNQMYAVQDKPIIFLYVMCQVFFNFGPNTTTYIIPAEFFPTRYRASCHGISAASGKLGSVFAQAIIYAIYVHRPSYDIQDWLGWTLIGFSPFMLIGLMATYFLIPPTRTKRKPMSLEQLAAEHERPKNNLEHIWKRKPKAEVVGNGVQDLESRGQVPETIGTGQGGVESERPDGSVGHELRQMNQRSDVHEVVDTTA